MRPGGRGYDGNRPIRCCAVCLQAMVVHSSWSACGELVLIGHAAWPLSYVARIGTDATRFSHSSWIVPVFPVVVIV